jgi:hypothetical protein
MDEGNHVQAIVDKLKPQRQIYLIGGGGGDDFAKLLPER